MAGIAAIEKNTFVQPYSSTLKNNITQTTTVETKSALQKADTFETNKALKPQQLQTQEQIKSYLAPTFNLLEKAGYKDVANQLKNSRYKITNGKFLSIEYFAAASPLTKTISLSKENFFSLSPAGQAAILLHENVHNNQNIFIKAFSNIVSIAGRIPKTDSSEKEAYKAEWAALPKLGINDFHRDNIVYFSTKIFLQDAGILPPD